MGQERNVDGTLRQWHLASGAASKIDNLLSDVLKRASIDSDMFSFYFNPDKSAVFFTGASFHDGRLSIDYEVQRKSKKVAVGYLTSEIGKYNMQIVAHIKDQRDDAKTYEKYAVDNGTMGRAYMAFNELSAHLRERLDEVAR